MPFFLFTAVLLSKYNTHNSRTYSCSGPIFESRPCINTSFPLVLPKPLNLITLGGTRNCDNNPWQLDVVFERINKVCEALPEGKKKNMTDTLDTRSAKTPLSLNPGIPMTFICLKYRWNEQAGEQGEVLAGTLAPPAMTGKTLLAVAVGWDNQEWCQIRSYISPLLPFKSQLSAWTMN